MEQRPSLSPSEWKVMEALWQARPRTITQLTAALAPTTGWSKHTVISFLNRMEQKGAVVYQEEGRARAYFPTYPREEATLAETERFLDRVFGGSLGLLVHSMVERKALSEEEISALTKLLQEAKGGDGDA